MHARTSSLGLVLCLALAQTAWAAGGTVTDQAVSLTYGTTHWGGGLPAASLTGADATGDAIYETGWWYRAEGDTREYPLPAPDSETYSDGRIVAVWNNLDGKGFRVEERTLVFDYEGPAGGFASTMAVRNDNAVDREFALFHYVDLDVAATGGDDLGTLVTSRYVKFQDGASRAAYRASSASHYQVGTYPGIRDLLNDATVTTLGDTGLPFGPGDASAAYQLGPSTISSGASLNMGLVSVFLNPATDRVKGDLYGVGLAALYGQEPGVGGRGFQLMRRTLQVPSGVFSVSGPAGTPRLEGVDDFHGFFRDSLVYRDAVSGVVYINSTAMSGAPTLPFNWKLSATGDFNADGKADILWRNLTSQKLVVWTMSGSSKVGSIIPSPDQAVDANWEVAAAADFNGDGNRDLLWYNQTSGKLVLWFMNASVVRITGQFTNPANVGNNNWRAVAVGDYGKGPGGVYNTQDIVWRNDTSQRVVVWHMDQAANRTGGVFITPDTLSYGWELVGPR